MRNIKVDQFAIDIDAEVEAITEGLGSFTEGPRCMFLMHRHKDGGHNKEHKRIFQSGVYYDREGFDALLRPMLVLQRLYSEKVPTRIYISVNRRDINRAARTLHTALVDAIYAGQENRDHVYRGMMKSTRTYLMQPYCRAETLFLIDVDRIEGQDTHGNALKWLAENKVDIILLRATKNGWHIITKPFNPTQYPKDAGEIKKDGLLCVSY